MITNREVYQIFFPVNKFDTADSIRVAPFMNNVCSKSYMENFVLPDTFNTPATTNAPTATNITHTHFALSAYMNAPHPSIIPDPELSSVSSANTVEPTVLPIRKSIWFQPRAADSLFWCLFYHVHGEYEYELVGQSYGNRELEEKQKIVEHYTGKHAKQNVATLKQGNQRLTIATTQEVLSGLMVNKTTQILELYVLASYYKVAVQLVDRRNKTYLELVPAVCTNPESPHIIEYDTESRANGRWRIKLESVPNQIDGLFKLEQWDKPMRAVSTYKLGELQEIADQVLTSGDRPSKKGELYDVIAQHVAWKRK